VNPEVLQRIIKGCVNKKRESQEQLFWLFSSKMFAVCLYYSKNKMEAEDLLHNGFIKVFKTIAQFRGDGSFEGWMRRVFTTTALEQFRKHKLLFIDDKQPNYFEKSTNSDDILSRINADELIEMIQELTPSYRIVFNLFAIEGYSHKEIAEMLKISEGTSKSNLSRARGILQKKLNQHLEQMKEIKR
jgi:RNA polymerase sigma-70 factor (ECF subfamily)